MYASQRLKFPTHRTVHLLVLLPNREPQLLSQI